MTSFQSAIDALTAHGCKPTSSGAGYIAYCPVHESDHNGHKPSLSFAQGDKQSIILKCHAGCTYPEIMAALGLKPDPAPVNGQRRIVATYAYRDATGATVFEKVRYEPKDFRIRHRPEPGADWVWKKPQLPEYPLYRLPELRAGIAAGETVWVCEGEKDANRLTALGFVATCNFEGAAKPDQKAKWRKEYTAQFAGAARVVLLPDHDEPGRAHMAAIAQALKGQVGEVRTLELPGLSGAKGDNDVSDWLDKGHTIAELLALAESAAQATNDAQEPPKKRPSTFKNLSTLLLFPPAENWLIKGFFAVDSTNVIFGESGCCKTFVTIDILCHIAAGLPWLGNPVKQGKVLYIAGEGQNGIIRRFKAWFEAHPGYESAIANIELRTIPAALCDPESTAILAQEIADMPDKPRAIAIDTLARNFGPGDENSTRDMTQFVVGLDKLREVSQAAIIVPHHSGHGEKNRGRGSSVLIAAIDSEYQVERQEVLGRKSEIVRMRCSKMKDSDPPPAQAWKLTQQPLPWCDEGGTFMNSAVLVPALDGEIGEQSGTFCQKQRLTPAQRIAVDSLRTALIQHGVEADGVVSVAEDQWRQAAYSAGISGSDQPRAMRQAFQRARQELVASHQVCTFDGRYWLPATRGTKGNKGEHCTVLYPGMEAGEEEQSGTSPFRGCSSVPPPADTQPLPEPTGEKCSSPPVGSIPDLAKSPTASRIRDCLAGDPAGMDMEVLVRTVDGKAGAALVRTVIEAMLLAGELAKVNGRLVLAGGGV